MLILFLLMVAAIGFVLFSAFASATRLPENRPELFLHDRNLHQKVVACLGDSLTHGSVSYNYVQAF
ncbi:hypothetical protein [Endozoicomonas arenosclerae]|uniref:hypothetical protein n=1 Tax=Endozoicomonas arenosclerae TaxID=1633495 RepID=UPI000780242F|nr:hypothetical protein [Endozoicomonas arenosclerae]